MMPNKRSLPKQLPPKPGLFCPKIFQYLLVALLLIIPSISSMSQVHALQAAEPTLKTIIIANYAPYSFVNPDGSSDGFSVELMQAVTQVMGVKLEIKVDTWDNARHALENGTIDFLPMMAYSAERDKLYDFSPPHTIAYDAFFTRKDANPIRSMDDLQGKNIIAMQSDQAHDYLSSLTFKQPGQIILVESLPDALRLLASGKGDTALMPKLVGLALIRDLNLTNLGLSPVVVEAYNRPFSFAVRDGNQGVLERLNQGLVIIKATGQYDEIYKKWFGTLEPAGITNELFFRVLGGTILTFVLGGALLLLWSVSLRKQVALRTKSLEFEIQERKQVEDALRMSEIEMNEAQAIAHLGSWKWEVGKGEISWSDEMFRIFGIDKNSHTGRLGDVAQKAMHPDDLHIVLPANAANIANAPFEYRIIRPDGANRLIRAKTANTIFDQNGKPTSMFGVAQDITESRQAEDEIRRLSKFPAENPNPVMRINQSGRILYANQASLPLLTTWEREPGQDLPVDWCNRIALAHETGQSMEVEVECQERFFSCILTPVSGEEYFNLYGIDITERKHTAALLRETNEYLENLFNYANAPIIVWDTRFTITRFNHAFENITGRSAAEVLGKSLDLLFPPERITASMELIKKTLAGERWEVVEIDIQHLDGSIRTVLWNSATLFTPDGKNPIATIAQGQDVTERKRAERSKIESEQRFHRTMNNMEEGIILLDYDWTYIYINKAAEIQGQRPAGELLGKTVMECWPGIESTDFFKLEQEVMQNRIPKQVEDSYTLLDGKEHWFNWHIQPAVEGLLIITVNITERKQIEAEMRQLNSELEQRVDERTRELRNTQEKLVRQERLATLGQLASSVGHELRNPLGVISNAVYYLKMSQPDASDKVREYLGIIEKETRASNKIITDLLDFTRLKTVLREQVSVPDLVKNVLARYPTPASVAVTLNIPNNLPKVFADPHQMEQVLGNLVVNAIQALETEGKLALTAVVQSNWVIIEVQDNGTGILPENMPKLFEPLFTTKTKGIGLGLAISRKLTEANGGRIEVTSELGKGSIFKLVLPIHNPETIPDPAYQPESPAKRDEEQK